MDRKTPYRPRWIANEESFEAHPGDRLITNQDKVTEPFPSPPVKSGERAWSAYQRRLSRWYADEGNKARERCGDPCRFDWRNMSSSDFDVVAHLLFDPEWRGIANRGECFFRVRRSFAGGAPLESTAEKTTDCEGTVNAIGHDRMG